MVSLKKKHIQLLYFVLVKIAAASMASTNGPVSAQGFSNVNQFMLQNLQTLISSNPEFLTGGIPTQLLSQLMNAAAEQPPIKMQPPKMAPNNYQMMYNQQFQQQQEEEEHDDEEMGVAETYADYWPAKRKLNCNKCFLYSYVNTIYLFV